MYLLSNSLFHLLINVQSPRRRVLSIAHPLRQPIIRANMILFRIKLIEHLVVVQCLFEMRNQMPFVRLLRLLQVRFSQFGVDAFLDDLVPGLLLTGHTIRESLLLPPEHGLRQQLRRFEGLPQEPFLTRYSLPTEFLWLHHSRLGIEGQIHIHKVVVEEGHSRLEPMNRNAPIRPQAVIEMQIVEQPDILLMELLSIGRLMEIQIAPAELIAALASQQHLNIRILGNPLRDEVQAGRGSDCRDVERLAHLYDDVQLVQPLLLRDLDVRVDRADVVGNHLREFGVGAVRHTDTVRAQFPVLLTKDVGGHGGHEAGVQPTRQQTPQGPIRIQPNPDCLPKLIPYILERIPMYLPQNTRLIIHLRLELQLPILGPRHMQPRPRRKLLNHISNPNKRLHLGGKGHSLLIPGIEERPDTEPIPRQVQIIMRLLCHSIQNSIENGEGELTVEFRGHSVDSVVFEQGQQCFDVRVRPEDVGLFGFDLTFELAVVVDLAVADHVHSAQHLFARLVLVED
jgi:hypothetical protein